MKNKNEREKFQRTETTEYTVYIIVFFSSKLPRPQKLYRLKIELFQLTNATDHATEYMYNIYFSFFQNY